MSRARRARSRPPPQLSALLSGALLPRGNVAGTLREAGRRASASTAAAGRPPTAPTRSMARPHSSADEESRQRRRATRSQFSSCWSTLNAAFP
eukprot:7333429-Alexandrium_andersonii.AAC.1